MIIVEDEWGAVIGTVNASGTVYRAMYGEITVGMRASEDEAVQAVIDAYRADVAQAEDTQ